MILGIVFAAACALPATEALAQVEPSLTATTRTFTFAVPAGAVPGAIAIAAGVDGLTINDYGQVVSSQLSPLPPGASGAPANVTSMGGVVVGSHGVAPIVISQGDVTVRSLGVAAGVLTSGKAFVQAGGNPGTVRSGADLTPTTTLSWTLALPGGTPVDVRLASDQAALALAPAAYGRVTTNRNTTLQLGAGTYRLSALDVAPQSTLAIDNRAGAVNIYVESRFIYRGSMTIADPGTPNVLFVYDGTSKVFLEQSFRATLVSPAAGISVQTSSLAGVIHPCSLYGLSVEVHPHVIIEQRPYQAVSRCPAGQPTFQPRPDYPQGISREIDNDAQGSAHDGVSWYFTNARVKVSGFGLEHRSQLWKVPLGQDLAGPIVLIDNPLQGTQNHFGDPSFRDGWLYVPAEPGRGGSATRAAILVFDPLLALHGQRELSVPGQFGADQGSACPWAAAAPGNEIMSSAFDASWLNVYEMPVEAGVVGPMSWQRSTAYQDCRTGQALTLHQLQGGELSESGQLYLVTGVTGGGVLVVEATNGLVQNFFPVAFDPSSDQELEGITIWDVAGKMAPGITGQIHVTMVDNNTFTDDNLFFKHFAISDITKL
jgi:hypothetical protein